MTRRVVFTAPARAGAIEAARWLATKSPAAAARWLVGLEKAVATLGSGPLRHPLAEDESATMGTPIREILSGRRPGVYRVMYTVEDNAVVIHEVRHAARGPVEP